MLVRTLAFLALLGILLALPTPAYAGDVGSEASGLPAIGRVSVAQPDPDKHVGVTGDIGYGLIESQSGESDPHHRIRGSVGAMVQPLRFLAASLVLGGRWDQHPDDVLGSSSTAIGEPRLAVRANENVGKAFALGAEMRLWFPGAEAPSVRFDASTLDLLALAAWTQKAWGLTLAIDAGYRRDNSSHVFDGLNRARLRRGDRLSVEASDFDAVPLGVGISERVGHAEILADVSTDLLLGTHAPGASVHFGLGGRYHVTEALAIELRPQVLVGKRPGSLVTDVLAPIDPRFEIALGVRYTPAFGVKPKPAEPPPVRPIDQPPAPPPIPMVALSGRVVDEKGQPIAKAQITIGERVLASDADGRFGASLPAGNVHAIARAAGYDEATVDAAAGPNIDFTLKKTIRPGQLRGLVRSFNGTALGATIRIEPLGLEVKTDADGMFQADVPPGAYQVEVTAAGFATQKRPVQVEENGVTVLNADMRPGKATP